MVLSIIQKHEACVGLPVTHAFNGNISMSKWPSCPKKENLTLLSCTVLQGGLFDSLLEPQAVGGTAASERSYNSFQSSQLPHCRSGLKPGGSRG